MMGGAYKPEEVSRAGMREKQGNDCCTSVGNRAEGTGTRLEWYGDHKQLTSSMGSQEFKPLVWGPQESDRKHWTTGN